MGCVPISRDLAASAYGLRTRLRVIHLEGREDRELRRWYPRARLLDPLSFLDLTTPWEQAWLTRELATRPATGAVVELGPWLGASSSAIARGLERAGRNDGFDTYDTFVFEDIEERTAGTPLEGRFHDGTSFRSLVEGRLGRHGERVRVHEGDVCGVEWTGGPIQLLFVDIAKTWDTWRAVRETFVAHVAVGGLVVQQDWAHANTPWLILWHHRWRRHFEPLGVVNHSPTVAFELRSPLPPEAIGADVLTDYRAQDVAAAFRWAETLVHPKMIANVVGAEIMLHALHGQLDDGVAALLAAARRDLVSGELASVAAPELARRIAIRDGGAVSETSDVEQALGDGGVADEVDRSEGSPPPEGEQEVVRRSP
ncbi:MAG: glycosyltransferase [Ilumatobacteraceae bacterium]|nr:glycosyltransferase [Ilumatobacteraceae bacterium]